MDNQKFQRGEAFDFPQSPEEIEKMFEDFYERIHHIVVDENHHKKFDGTGQLSHILNDAAYEEKNCIKFTWIDGILFFDFEVIKQDDVLNLPKVARRFSRIYRHKASKYFKGEGKSVAMLKGADIKW